MNVGVHGVRTYIDALVQTCGQDRALLVSVVLFGSAASVANEINRFSVGTKNRDLAYDADGSLTIHVQPDAPSDASQRQNWLPAPKGSFSLYIRTYWPKVAAIDGSWTPPPVRVVK